MTGAHAAEPSPDAPAWRADAAAGLVAAVSCVLLAAPVGLLWEARAPHVVVDVEDGSVSLVSEAAVFLDGDLVFLAIVTVVGVLVGLGAWWLGRRWGPGVVVGLVAGGLLAAWIAAMTGELVDEGVAREAVEAGRSGRLELSLRLRAREAVLGWPIGALVGFALPYWLRRPAPGPQEQAAPAGVSWATSGRG